MRLTYLSSILHRALYATRLCRVLMMLYMCYNYGEYLDGVLTHPGRRILSAEKRLVTSFVQPTGLPGAAAPLI